MRINPILSRELRERMRSRRVVIMITAYLLLVLGACALAYSAVSTAQATQMDMFEGGMDSSVFLPTQAAEVGRAMFAWTVTAMLVLLALGVPTMAASAVAGERERDTLIPLQVTPLGAPRMVWGKIMATVSFMGLLMVAAAPILALSFVVGGVRISEVLLAIFGLLVTALVLAAIGVMVSAFMKRTLSAALISNFLVGSLFVGTVIVAEILASDATGARHPRAARWPLLANPVVLVGDLVGDDSVNDTNLWDQIKKRYTGEDSRFLVPQMRQEDIMFGGEIQIGEVADDEAVWRKAAWNWPVRAIAMFTVMVGACWFIASTRLRTPAKKDR
jgi:ABC-type transport system involved in multi-copper enzyme maturation permease subunit